MNKTFKFLTLVACMYSAFALQAGNAMAVNMREALQAARVNDPAFRAAAAERKARKLDEDIGRSFLLPSVVASYSEGRARYDREFTGNTGQTRQESDVDLKSYSVQLRQPLYSLDAMARFDLGKESSQESDHVFRFNEFDLVQRTASAYIDVLIALEQLNAATAQSEALAESLKLATQQKEGGETSRLDVLDVTAKHDLAKAQLLEAQYDLEAKVRTLEGYTGLKITNIASVSEDYLPALPAEAGFEQLRQQMLQSNPEVLIRRSRIEQAKIQKNRAFAGHTPRVDLVASKSFSENDTVNTIDQSTDAETLQVQLQLPLFSGFGTSAQVEQADERVRQEKARLDDTVLQKDTELNKVYLQGLVNRNKIQAYQTAVVSAEEAVKAARLGQQAGVRIRLDELTALQQLYLTRRDYLRTKFEALINLVKLKLVVGGSTADEISGLFDMFDSKRVEVTIPRVRPEGFANDISIEDERSVELTLPKLN